MPREASGCREIFRARGRVKVAKSTAPRGGRIRRAGRRRGTRLTLVSGLGWPPFSVAAATPLVSSVDDIPRVVHRASRARVFVPRSAFSPRTERANAKRQTLPEVALPPRMPRCSVGADEADAPLARAEMCLGYRERRLVLVARRSDASPRRPREQAAFRGFFALSLRWYRNAEFRSVGHTRH